MKTAMKLTTGILAISMMAGAAWAQKPDAIEQARSEAKSLQQQQANGPAKSKPAPGAPAPAVKPAAIPGSQASAAPAKAAVAASDNNQLKHVSVVPGADNVQVEISSTRDITPKVSKLTSPARVVVELPETVVASAQNKIPVGTDGVKGVRIGMDGKTPPTTSVVVDLEKAVSYEIAPGAAGKLILTLHTQGADTTVVKSAPASKQAKLVPVKAEAVPLREAAKPVSPAKAGVAKAAPIKAAPVRASVAKVEAPKASAPAKQAPKQQKTVVAAKPAPAPASAVAAADALPKPAAPKPEEKKWAMNGKRDPFFSPVVQQSGSGCSTGKKCLEIGTINLRGVVKSDTGFIAVVTNNLNKAYFLRENDPVFNGYVVKITGDSVTFSETVQDKLGKPFTHEVVKRIFTPAV
jgi:Tfp pilus assembly protein PilP